MRIKLIKIILDTVMIASMHDRELTKETEKLI